MHKFESPKRVEELNPKGTLINTGLKGGDVFCDIGTGPGLFTIEAAKITGAKVYAIDTSNDMLEIVAGKAETLRLNNIELINPEGFSYPIEDGFCDYVLLSTVLHEIDDKQALLAEINRILKPGGRLVIIELHKRETPIGPPLSHRISFDETRQLAEEQGFVLWQHESMGENFYLTVFGK